MTQSLTGRMDRRKFLGGASATAMLAVAGSKLQSVNARTSKPNVVFILADDLGWADLSIYGRTEYRTPNLDRLARQGVRFTNAYAAQTVCTPTRIAFYTGRYPGRLRVGLREPLGNRRTVGGTVGLPPDHPTIATLLRANGYATAVVGKWHAGYSPTFGPLKNGFDEFFGNYSGGIDYFTHKDGSGELDFYEGETPVNVSGYATDLYTARAIEIIKRPRNKPLFLALTYNAPHWPWEGPADEALSRNFYNTNGFTAGGSPRTYAAMIKSLDDGIGRVLKAIEDSGQADNTIVIFTSDNGGERYSAFGPFRGRKGSLFEGGIRVPAIVRYPGVATPNQVSSQPIITQDITATILEATGTRPDPAFPLDAESLLPYLSGRQSTSTRTLYWRFGGAARTQRAARNGKWKYLRPADGVDYLYDLSTDPGETIDLKATYPEVFNRLLAQYEQWNAQLLPYGS